MVVFVETATGKAIEAYKNAVSGRFYHNSHLVLVLLIYEILFFFSSEAQVVKYNGIDAWFKLAQSHIPGGTLLISLTLIIYLGYYVYHDWFGLWTTREYKKARDDAKSKKKKISEFRKKPLKDGAINWYYWFFIILEGFVYGSFIRMLLPYFNYALVAIVDPEVLIPAQLDAVRSLKSFHTNVFQDLSLTFGGGFYDEWIFRGLLLAFLFRVFNKELGSWSMGDLKKADVGKFVKIPKGSLGKFDNYIMDMQGFKRRKKSFAERFPIVLMAAVIYSLSHFTYYYGDEFTIYNAFYRVFFAIIMYFVFANRRLPVAVWTHVFYNFWYFLFL